MTEKLRYRSVQYNVQKVFDHEPRVLTYRGATYQTRMFEAQIQVLQTR